MKAVRAKAPSKPTAAAEVPKARTTARKPLANRANSPDPKLPAKKVTPRQAQAQAENAATAEREPVMVDHA
jgi:kinesin family protein 20/kinesin family protein 23